MTDEDIIDCIMELDKVLDEVEDALEHNNHKKAMEKVKLAREIIEDLREDDEADDTREIGMNVMNKLK